jgi:cobaltochelatase CobT
MQDRELAGLAMVLGRDCKMKVTITGEDSYCGNGHINIARMPATPLGKMLACGLVFHEVGHHLHTTGDRPPGLVGNLTNVVEDVRTERLTIAERPGTRFNLDAVTTHYTDKGDLTPENIVQALIGKALGFGRNTFLQQAAAAKLDAASNEMLDEAFGQSFIADIEKVLNSIPHLTSAQESQAMAQELVNLLIHEKKKQAKQQAKANQSGQSGQPGQGDPGQGQPGQPGKADKAQPGQGKDQGAGNGPGAGNQSIDEMLLGDPTYGDISKLIQKEMNALAQNSDSPLLPKIIQASAKERMDEVAALSASSRMRARLIGFLAASKRKPKDFGLNGRRIAVQKLHKIPMGDPKIFKKKTEVKAVNTAVMVCIDLSGSMNKMRDLATQAAFAVHHALYGLRGVSVSTVCFKGSEKDIVRMLVPFDRKPDSSLLNQNSGGGTPTDNALWAARAMILNRPEPRKIVLVITDGDPNNPTGVRAAIKRITRDGIEQAAIGIGEGIKVKDYWKVTAKVAVADELPHAMFGIMEKLLIGRSYE